MTPQAGGNAVPAIALIGVPTRNRPSQLRTCLLSHAENARRHGRSPQFVVVDDSEDETTRAANREVLHEVNALHGVPLSWAGPQERGRFCESLARQAGVATEVVAFALLNPERCPIATGASRNALLLHAVGDLLLQVDDDTCCRLVSGPQRGGGLCFSSRFDPTEFWFLPEESPGAEPAGEEVDLLGLHEELLGRENVTVTAAGVIGDSGMGSSLYLLGLDGPARQRLLRSERDYRFALRGHQVLRAVTRATVCARAVCMAMNLGLDNRRLLPPFLPVQRSQDGVFAALVRACLPGALFGFLPWAVWHRSPLRRDFTTIDLVGSAARVSCGQVVQALVAAAPQPGRTPADSLRAVGRTLAGWGALPLAEFEELVKLHAGGQRARLAARLEGQLQRHDGQPGYWADDVRRVLGAMQEGLLDERFTVPVDLEQALGYDSARQAMPRLLRRLGALLLAWPDLVEAARALRRRGERLAYEVRR